MEQPEGKEMINSLQPLNHPKPYWVVEIEKVFESSSLSDCSPKVPESDKERIHKVPESLPGEKTKEFYAPQVLFLGPYHCKESERKDNKLERLKIDIARDMLNPGPKKKEESSAGVDESVNAAKGKEKEESSANVDESALEAAIENFMQREEEIKQIYAEKLEVSGKELAWTMTKDAYFVLHVLKSFGRDEGDEKSESAPTNRTLSGKRYHPVMTDIVKDVLKMENQLPFWALEDIIPHEDPKVLLPSAMKNLAPINVQADPTKGPSDRQHYNHILQILHDYIVDESEQSSRDFTCCCYCCSLLCCPLLFCLAICSKREWDNLPRFFRPLVCLGYLILSIILIVLSPVLLVMFIIFLGGRSLIERHEWENVRTIEELKRLGVKFERLKGSKRGISQIKFRSSTLYLPQFKVDNRSEVILRNLIAWEICSKEKKKPITSYAMMMNDLINTKDDVAILRRADIIINKLGSDEQVAELWNSVAPFIEDPKYEPIKNAVRGIKDYCKTNWKTLWAQFVITHCSKPWLILSLFAGIILLLLTVLQTTCLFVSCEVK